MKQNLDSYRGAPGAPNSGPLLTILFKFVSDVQVVDPLNVKVTLSTRSPTSRRTCTPRVASGWSRRRSSNAGEACATNMIGTGPFKLEDYKQNEATVVVKNEDYWQEGFPKAEKITFVPVVDGAVRVNQLQGGQLRPHAHVRRAPDRHAPDARGPGQDPRAEARPAGDPVLLPALG